MTSAALKTHQRASSRNEFRGFTEFSAYNTSDRQKIVTILVAARNKTRSAFASDELPRNKTALEYLLNELKVEHSKMNVTYSRRLGIVITEKEKT